MQLWMRSRQSVALCLFLFQVKTSEVGWILTDVCLRRGTLLPASGTSLAAHLTRPTAWGPLHGRGSCCSNGTPVLGRVAAVIVNAVLRLARLAASSEGPV